MPHRPAKEIIQKIEIEERRQVVRRILRSIGKRIYKREGFACISDQIDRNNVIGLLRRLSNIGVFVVPIGEVECWLGNLGVPLDPKKTWLTRMFRAMGSAPGDPDYVSPKKSDVWNFLDRVANWIANPNISLNIIAI